MVHECPLEQYNIDINTNFIELIVAFWKSEQHYYKKNVKSFWCVGKSFKDYLYNFLINFVSLVFYKCEIYIDDIEFSNSAEKHFLNIL